MTNSSDSDSLPENIPTNDIDQKVGENQGLVVGQASGSTVIGSITHNYYHAPDVSSKVEPTPLVSEENPYKGLEAFEEDDRDLFFGRDAEIKGENGLLKRFQDLRNDQDAVRILPVYGASGSGKSSLVKAGLVPILRDGLKEGDLLLLMKPSGDPIGELAKVLVHELSDSQLSDSQFPFQAKGVFEAFLLEQREVLTQDGTKNKDFDGLHRIIDSDKQVKSLILVIDQFEEIYTYRPLPSQRDVFIENLLYAASHRSQRVSVILTMRIDFVGKTHEYPTLNKLFASPPGVYVPIMQRDQLAIAISEPAKRSGHPFTEETIDLLLAQSQGQEGALPLLQFALTQIWEGLLTGIAPIETLRKIGGVGGALANKAQEAYDALKTDQEKQIARSIFLKLILLNDDNRATRRRVLISDLLIGNHKEQSVREVVAHFAQAKVRILVTSAPVENPKLETVEIAHEALIDNWEELKGWLRENKKAKLQGEEIERLRKKWENQNRSKDYLLEGRNLRDALEFQKSIRDSKIRELDLSVSASELIAASHKKQKSDFIKRVVTIFIFPTLFLTPLIFHFGTLFIANQIIYKKGCDRNLISDILLQYQIDYGNKRELNGLQLCNQYLSLLNLSKEKLDLISDSDFSESDLSSTKFFKITIRNTKFIRAKLFNTNFQETRFVDSDFQDTSFFNTNLTKSVSINVNYRNTSFRETRLEDAVFIKSDLSMTDLDHSQASKIKVCESQLPQELKINKDRDCSFSIAKRYRSFR